MRENVDDKDKMEELIQFGNRTELIRDLRLRNGASGLKTFDKLLGVLDQVQITKVDGVVLTTSKEDVLKVRQQARTLVTVRSGAVLLKKRKASEVQALFAEAKLLKVKIPKNMQAKLDSLAAEDEPG